MLGMMRRNPNICIDPIYYRLCNAEQQNSLNCTNVLRNNMLPSNQVRLVVMGTLVAAAYVGAFPYHHQDLFFI